MKFLLKCLLAGLAAAQYKDARDQPDTPFKDRRSGKNFVPQFLVGNMNCLGEEIEIPGVEAFTAATLFPNNEDS